MGSDHEERFINKYAAKGYRLAYISPYRLMPPLEYRIYKFNDSDAAKLVYRIDNRKFEDTSDYENYMQLMKDDGWEFFKNNYSYTKNWYPEYYWFRERVTGDEDIYSDNESKLEARNRGYTRLLTISLMLLASYMVLLAANVYQPSSSQGIIGFIFGNWYPSALIAISVTMIIGKISIKVIQRKNPEI